MQTLFTWVYRPKTTERKTSLVNRFYLSRCMRGLASLVCLSAFVSFNTFASTSNLCKQSARLIPCDSDQFVPYIGPYLTLIQPAASENKARAKSLEYSHILDPARAMVINYEVSDNSDFRGAVFYRQVTSKGKSKKWRLQYADEYTSGLDASWGSVQHISLQGLRPDTSYQYRVVAPDGATSRQYSFRTAAKNAHKSRFLVIGDMQDEQQAQRWQDVADAITQDHMGDFDFIITVGDMVKDDIHHQDDRFHWWKVFFDKGQNVFAHKPIFPAMGNHDTPDNPSLPGDKPYQSNSEDTRTFRKYFYLNTDMAYPDYYSFSYGNACFISVNSEIPVFFGANPKRQHVNDAGKRQKQWLDDEVKKAQSCMWSFAYWHVPPINPAGGKDEVRFLRPYAADFSQHIDWSITGHVHEYQRLKPLHIRGDALDLKTEYGRAADRGVGHIIAPPAGQWPRGNVSDDMSALAYYPHNENGVAFEIGFSIINVDRDAFDLKTYGMGGVGSRVQPKGYRANDDRTKKLIDQVTYKKHRP